MAAAVFADGGCVWHAGDDALALGEGLKGAHGGRGQLGEAFALLDIENVVVTEHGHEFVFAGGGVGFVGFEEFPEDDEVAALAFADLAAQLFGFGEGDEDGLFVGDAGEHEPVDAAIRAAVPVAWRVAGGCPIAFPRANACFEAGDDAVGDFLVEITLGGFGCGGGGGGRCHGVAVCL